MICLGTVKKYCRDDYTLIKNYEQAVNSPEKWECHHWNEQWFTRKELIKLGRYFKVPHDELVFMTCKEHQQWHSQYGAERKEKCRKIGEFRKGKPRSEETKQRISESLKGHPVSEESKQRISESLKGHPVSEESKQRISESLKGHPVSEETKNQISESMKGRTSPMKGKTLSGEHKQRISESLKGMKYQHSEAYWANKKSTQNKGDTK